ncbi:uncharacterized protein LOC125946854 isoform X2 [Dermacentor silvarum]|uniref:uncharacterized protein LOC125946854 isoform X2 n=1 Tax=Dermacentor silvarum TaxID=543639 RepID=UPI002101A7B2|nr:uncharacterized protein LOC125946854 isoform X2 [Dermacentor silvarum]
MKLERTFSYYFEFLTFSFLTGITITSASGDTYSSAMKLLRNKQKPLYLFGVEASSISDHNCWRSTYDSTGANSVLRHTVKRNWNDQTPDPRKQNEADVHLKVTSTGGSVMLNVEVVGTPPLKTVIEGNYRIHYADENCAVISSTRGTGVCTLWVQENTTSLPHADCKEAFSKNCQTCTTNQPAATS